MPRITKPQQVIRRKTFTQQELDSVLKDVNGDLSNTSKLNWLVRKGAIRIRIIPGTNGGRDLQDVVVKHSPDGSFKYSELCDLWEELEKRELYNKDRQVYNNSYEHVQEPVKDTLFVV